MNYAWILEIRPGYEEEYKKRHDEIWPEMVQMLKEAGLRNYNIFRYGIILCIMEYFCGKCNEIAKNGMN